MNTIGRLLQATVFGESHGQGVGCVLSGLPAGTRVDEAALRAFLARRSPGGAHASARREGDVPRILSGISPEGRATGAPIALWIGNEDGNPREYEGLPARPSHADYPAYVKYNGFAERSGGGFFSGRLTAALCCAGGLALQALEDRGVRIGAHLVRVGRAQAERYDPLAPDMALRPSFPARTEQAERAMLAEIERARAQGDSVGGEIECAALGLPAGVGEPFFSTAEGELARILFAIPGVKGVQFGGGFALAAMRGSRSNDPMALRDGGVVHEKNSMGGIDGGISNGAPLLFSVAVKPTPTIAAAQRTVSLPPLREEDIAPAGRHDPCIAPRAVPVVEAAAALVLLDLILIGGFAHG